MGAEYNRAIESQAARGGLLRRRIVSGRPLLLDGATGTELERRGVPSALPLWSTHALLESPQTVAEIHAEYVAAGAEVLTANTFRTQRRTLERAGMGERAEELTALAVSLARRGAGEHSGRVFVAGSAPTLEDCYRPDLRPDENALEGEHREHVEHLASAGVDLILVETMNSVAEAVAAARAAAATRLPFFVSFVSWTDARLLSGEPLSEGLAALASSEPTAVLVNCLPVSSVAPCLPLLRESGFPFGVYANLGPPDAREASGIETRLSPEEFALRAESWLGAGASLIGGCCGTTPAHIRALAELLRV